MMKTRKGLGSSMQQGEKASAEFIRQEKEEKSKSSVVAIAQEADGSVTE